MPVDSPSHSTSALEQASTDAHWRKGGWGGREHGADGRLGRKGAWGGRSMGRKGAWGGREAGADGSLGRKGVWGGREYGALGTSRHTILHFDPQATTFLSPPGGIYLISWSGSVTRGNHAERAVGGRSRASRRAPPRTEGNTATRVPERVGTGRFSAVGACLGPPTDRPTNGL